MIKEKTTVSARVNIAIKMIVNDSEYTHKIAYELGAAIIGMGKAEEIIALMENNPDYERAVKQKKCQILKAEKIKIEKELLDL